LVLDRSFSFKQYLNTNICNEQLILFESSQVKDTTKSSQSCAFWLNFRTSDCERDSGGVGCQSRFQLM